MSIEFSESISEFKDKSFHIMWSGGCDSTLVLYDLLNFLSTRKDDSRIINAYSFSHFDLGPKVDFEKQARNKFLCYLSTAIPIRTSPLLDPNEDKLELPNKFDANKILNVEVPLVNKPINGRRCPQPAMWLSYILPLLPNNSVLFSGYHEGDCFFEYEIFSAFKKAAEGLCDLYEKNIIFCTPLKYKKKTAILRDLIELKIYDYTWYCENPTVNKGKCGHCGPCILHKISLKYIEEEDSIKKKESLLIKDLIKEEDPVKLIEQPR